MVTASTSTIDMAVASGNEIPIETRDTAEILSLNGQTIAAENANAWNLAFDMTPAEFVDVIVKE